MLTARTTDFLRAVVLTAILAAGGCETMPVQEMSDARQAISAAREAGAEEHATQQLMAAESALHSAEEHLNSHEYAVARREALAAKSNAIDALHRSEAARETEN